MSIITIKGNRINIDGKTEWLLFNRLIKKLHPYDFLIFTDALIQLPNFLYTVSLLTIIFIDTDLWVKFAVSSGLYFLGQMMVNLKFGIGVLKVLKPPLMLFSSINMIIMFGLFVTCFFFIGWWTLLLIPIYLLNFVISMVILTSSVKRYFEEQLLIKKSNNEIFHFNAFLVTYNHFAKKYKLTMDTKPTDEEVVNLDCSPPFSYMRNNWEEMENLFSSKAQKYWRAYLQLNKKSIQ